MQRSSIFVIMGVSGSGKTTIGTLLARHLSITFADADEYHSAENKQKMHDGQALTDVDRAPWLSTLNQLLLSWETAGIGGVLACSALKASYRETLGANLPAGSPVYVWLDGSQAMIAARLRARQGSFMNPVLLGSQIATLELPVGALRIVNDKAPGTVVEEILQKLQEPAAIETHWWCLLRKVVSQARKRLFHYRK